MVQLAIKGHTTRGKEVIEILEMLGGENYGYYAADMPDYTYMINEYGMIDRWFPHGAQRIRGFIESILVKRI